MPCKIEIRKKIESSVEQLTESTTALNLKSANEVAKEVNDSFGVKVVEFVMVGDVIDKSISIPESLIQTYFDSELEMEKQEAARLLKEEEEKERKYVESKKEEWEENREYFENDEPFTRASVDEKPIPDTGIQGTLFQNTSPEGQIASEKTIRELAARMSDRIGIPIRFESDRTKQYKGKIENNIAYINLAYATLDTPIHEILGHPIIRAIKNRDKTFFDIIVKKTSAGYQIRYTSKEGIYDMIVNSKIYKTEEEANKEANLLYLHHILI